MSTAAQSKLEDWRPGRDEKGVYFEKGSTRTPSFAKAEAAQSAARKLQEAMDAGQLEGGAPTKPDAEVVVGRLEFVETFVELYKALREFGLDRLAIGDGDSRFTHAEWQPINRALEECENRLQESGVEFGKITRLYEIDIRLDELNSDGHAVTASSTEEAIRLTAERAALLGLNDGLEGGDPFAEVSDEAAAEARAEIDATPYVPDEHAPHSANNVSEPPAANVGGAGVATDSQKSSNFIPQNIPQPSYDDGEVKELPLDRVRTDGGTQMRAALNEGFVDELVASMRESAEPELPPGVVFYDGTDYWLADGFHRVAAYRKEGLDLFDFHVKAGTRRDAVLHAAGANAAHGLRRTDADKRRAVETLLRDEEWSKWSNRAVAEACGVSKGFVGDVREGLFGVRAPEEVKARRGDSEYTVKTAGITAGGKRGDQKVVTHVEVIPEAGAQIKVYEAAEVRELEEDYSETDPSEETLFQIASRMEGRALSLLVNGLPTQLTKELTFRRNPEEKRAYELLVREGYVERGERFWLTPLGEAVKAAWLARTRAHEDSVRADAQPDVPQTGDPWIDNEVVITIRLRAGRHPQTGFRGASVDVEVGAVGAARSHVGDHQLNIYEGYIGEQIKALRAPWIPRPEKQRAAAHPGVAAREYYGALVGEAEACESEGRLDEFIEKHALGKKNWKAHKKAFNNISQYWTNLQIQLATFRERLREREEGAEADPDSVYAGDDAAALIQATEREQRGRWEAIGALHTEIVGENNLSARGRKRRKKLGAERAALMATYRAAWNELADATSPEEAKRVRALVEMPVDPPEVPAPTYKKGDTVRVTDRSCANTFGLRGEVEYAKGGTVRVKVGRASFEYKASQLTPEKKTPTRGATKKPAAVANG